MTTIESVFLYGSETWTLTRSTEKKIDGACTRMLRTALINVSWREQIPIKICTVTCQKFLARSGKEE